LVLLRRHLAPRERQRTGGLHAADEPGPDVAPIHNRQVVIVERENWARWLDASKPAADLLHALPQGSLQRLMLGAAGLGG